MHFALQASFISILKRRTGLLHRADLAISLHIPIDRRAAEKDFIDLVDLHDLLELIERAVHRHADDPAMRLQRVVIDEANRLIRHAELARISRTSSRP